MDLETKLGNIHVDGHNNNWKLESKTTERENMEFNELFMTPKNRRQLPADCTKEDEIETFTMVEYMEVEVHYKYKRVV